MKLARDPASGLDCTPNPGAIGTCPFCGGRMGAKCGDEVGWHWFHVADTCQEWETHQGEPGDGHAHDLDPRRRCESCRHNVLGCVSRDERAERWRAAWFSPGFHGPGKVKDGAPGCPAYGAPWRRA